MDSVNPHSRAAVLRSKPSGGRFCRLSLKESERRASSLISFGKTSEERVFPLLSSSRTPNQVLTFNQSPRRCPRPGSFLL
uniref:Orf80 protein n=1 Tax=Methanosarcina mazei TaxID=2209 RepID=O53140_METMZ|nr:Orf80 [Methanosarcina mazei]